jgi:ABC-type sugar transport system substrate-binding protein
MAQIKVMKLWNAFVTGLLALCTALGLITVTATVAAATTSTSTSAAAQATTPAVSPWTFTRSLPPTMKQRIRAEAHGKSPSCRHRPPTDTDEATEAVEAMEALDSAEPAVPLQR